MYKFNNTDITTSYIKGLLHEFNLPQCEVWKPGMRIYENCFYIYTHMFLRAIKTGEPTEMSTKYFKVINDDYTFGSKIFNITKNLVIKNLIYDSYTHEYLGNYLRFLRDYKNIDLMSLYNCFSNKMLSNITIYNGIEVYEEGKIITKDFSNTDGSKIYMIDILPYKDYTLFIDSNEPVEMIACYHDGDNLIDLKFGDTQAISFPYSSTYMKQANLSFNKPILYNKMNKENMSSSIWKDVLETPLAYNHRKQLKLLVKVAASNNSSLVILEGNYIDNNKTYFLDNGLAIKDIITSIPYDESGSPISTIKFDQSVEGKYISKLGLTKLQTNIQYPFSDRLIEYLFENVITPDDKIENNIARVQEIFAKGVYAGKLTDTSEPETVYLNRIRLHGVWDNAIRNCAYSIAKKKGVTNTKYDILGYIDKDIEKTIGMED